MMKIIYILPDIDAGVASVVRNLLRYKQSKVYTKVILLHNAHQKSMERVKDDFNCDEMVRIKYNDYWNSRKNTFKKIKSHITKDSIIISNDGSKIFQTLQFYNLVNPIIYIMHGDYKFYYNIISAYGNRIDKIICVSNFLKNKVDKILKDKQINTKVYSIKFPTPPTISLSDTLTNKVRIVYAGSLIESKGVKLFPEIIDILTKNKINYQFNIIGNGTEKQHLISEFKMNKRVSFLGHLSNQEVLKMHKKHDVLLLCSEKEGLPVSIVEGMKAGVIPIVNNIESGVPELVINGLTGYVVQNNEPKTYANNIIYLSKNKTILLQLKQNCIKFANNNFDPKKQSLAYEKEFLDYKSFKLGINEKQATLKKLIHLLPIKISNFIVSNIPKYFK